MVFDRKYFNIAVSPARLHCFDNVLRINTFFILASIDISKIILYDNIIYLLVDDCEMVNWKRVAG